MCRLTKSRPNRSSTKSCPNQPSRNHPENCHRRSHRHLRHPSTRRARGSRPTPTLRNRCRSCPTAPLTGALDASSCFSSSFCRGRSKRRRRHQTAQSSAAGCRSRAPVAKVLAMSHPGECCCLTTTPTMLPPCFSELYRHERAERNGNRALFPEQESTPEGDRGTVAPRAAWQRASRRCAATTIPPKKQSHKKARLRPPLTAVSRTDGV